MICEMKKKLGDETRDRKKIGRQDVRPKKWGDETQEKKLGDETQDKKNEEQTQDKKKWGDEMRDQNKAIAISRVLSLEKM